MTPASDEVPRQHFDSNANGNRVKLPAQIPCDNPVEALDFCRALKQLMDQSGGKSTVQISVVVPIFNELELLNSLCNRLHAVLRSLNKTYEIILVDDASTDGSFQALRERSQQEPHLVVITLARNFGHQSALSAGLDHARGDVVVMMDGDLQDPPEAIPHLLGALDETCDVVYAQRTDRKEWFGKRACYALFYRILRVIADIDIPADAGDFSVMTRRAAHLIQSMPERSRFLRGLRSWIGLTQKGIEIPRDARASGKSKYSLSRLFRLASDGLISFSVKPIRVITAAGLIFAALALALTAYYLIKRITVGLNPPGFATITVMLTFFFAVQLLTLGVIGEYVARIFEESKRRPLYIIKTITRSNS